MSITRCALAKLGIGTLWRHGARCLLRSCATSVTHSSNESKIIEAARAAWLEALLQSIFMMQMHAVNRVRKVAMRSRR